MRSRAVERIRAEIAPYRRGVVAGAMLAATWALWASGPGPTTPALVVAALAGGALGVIDARTRRLPNAITYPTTGVVALLLAVAAIWTGDWAALGRAALGAAALWGCYLVLHLIDRGGMGWGDVKLAVLLGAVAGWHGWSVLAAVAVVPFLVGGLVAVVLLVTGRATRKTALPFGPFMLAGTALALTWHRLTVM